MQGSIKAYWKKEGLRRFIIRCLLFLLIITIIPLLTYKLVLATTPPTQFLPFSLVTLGQAALFSIIAFFIISREKLKKLKKHPFIVKESIIFFILSMCSVIAFFVLRTYVYHNYSKSLQNSTLIILGMTLSILFWIGFLIIAIFNTNTIKEFKIKIKKEIIISFILFICSYLVFTGIQRLWKYLSKIVATSVTTLLSIISSNVTLQIVPNGSPHASINGFNVTIGQPCSGVDSMLLFIGLYSIIVAYDWKILNKKKLFILFIPGLIGIFLFNILRVFLLMLFGAYVSPAFAIGLFHSNIGWILFIIYSLIFWYFAYPWMKK
jgi:exosortase/archaeosortase family protein